MVASLPQVQGTPVLLVIDGQLFGRDAVPRRDVVGGSDVDVGIHVSHACQLVGSHISHVLCVRSSNQSSLQLVVEDVDEWLSTGPIGFLDQSLGQGICMPMQFNEDLLALLEVDRPIDQKLRELPYSCIFHADSPLFSC